MNMKAVLLATRPKTLVAALVPPLVAYFLYRSDFGNESFMYFGLCVLFALAIQIATNFYNDGIDFIKGADKDRVGPARMTSENLLSYKSIMLIGHLFVFISFLALIPLTLKGGVIVGLVGLLSLYLSYGYTGGPFPLAYLGLGEIFVFIFFGLVAVSGSYYILSGTYSIVSILLGVCVGLLSCVLIAVNNYRDRKTDVLVNKNTLATKMSDSQYKALLDVFMFLPHIIMFGLAITVKLSYIVPLLAVSFAHKTRFVIHNHQHESELNKALKYSGAHLLFFGILFALGTLWQ